jgi:hypothetical protein
MLFFECLGQLEITASRAGLLRDYPFFVVARLSTELAPSIQPVTVIYDNHP